MSEELQSNNDQEYTIFYIDSPHAIERGDIEWTMNHLKLFASSNEEARRNAKSLLALSPNSFRIVGVGLSRELNPELSYMGFLAGKEDRAMKSLLGEDDTLLEMLFEAGTRND